ncbi:ferritin-like domain-containing protein [Pseudoduganella violaceinigra]|uniref:ferritin-like domain-containing protein n=1 Tax=Pseudoduganella violaceinigra TaxID=246602 RepID=UPI00041336E9|nr:ferritin-like domain-containing protein [Pseudoduganella violaceinigra]
MTDDAIAPREHLTDWLRDAHAMEQQAEAMLKAMAQRLEHYPDLHSRVVEHLGETRWQREQLEGCLTRLGSSPSTVKDITGKLMAFGESVVAMMASDEVVKGAMAGYVFEHMEIASYTVLIKAADTAGDLQTKGVCEQIIKQEAAMAEWLLQHLPATTSNFLSRSARPGVEAKV